MKKYLSLKLASPELRI